MNKRFRFNSVAISADIVKVIISVLLIYLVVHGQQAQAGELDTGVVGGTLGNSNLVQQSVKHIFQKIPRALSNRQLSDRHFSAAVKHLSAGDVDKAENNLGLALSYDDGNSRARDLLVTLYSKTGRSELAIAMLQDNSVYSRPTLTSTLLLANLLAERGDTREAISVMMRVSPAQYINEHSEQQQEREYLQYSATLAALFYRDAQYENAQTVYQDLLKKNPNNSVWWLGLGVTLEASAHNDAALKAYEQAKQHGLSQGVIGQFVEKRISVLNQQQSSLASGQAG